MNSPLISIIVPVYNVEPYLRKCLDSILAQTYTDWEAILVDDGSTDRSGEICDEYTKKNTRVRVIHKENGGVSSARNCGIKESEGGWCCFIDSDDWIEPTYLQNFLVEGFTKYDCILQSFYRDYEDERTPISYTLFEGEIHSSSELEYYLEYTYGVHNGFLWHRLFKVGIIKEHKLEFVSGISFAEDGIFFLNYLFHADRYYITQKPGYHYLMRGNSLTSKGRTLPKNIYYFLLENFASPTLKIVKKDKPDKGIVNGLKLYMWRLLYNWILIRSMKSTDDYYHNYSFLSVFFEKYPINRDVKTSSIALKLIIRNVSKSPTQLRYFVIKTLCVVYENECKLKRIREHFL